MAYLRFSKVRQGKSGLGWKPKGQPLGIVGIARCGLGLGSKERAMSQRAWLVTAFGDDRQYGGNTGYTDEPSSIYASVGRRLSSSCLLLCPSCVPGKTKGLAVSG